MSIDFGVLKSAPLLIAVLVIALMGLKAAAIYAMSRLMGLPFQERPMFTLMLAQGGEFAFVVFQQAVGLKILDAQTGSILVGAVALSMLLSPLILVLIDKLLMPRLADIGRLNVPELAEAQSAKVIVAGVGRFGQIVLRVLTAAGYKATVLDHDAEQVQGMTRFGYRAFYGDATRLDLLRTAGAAQAHLLVVAVDDVEQSLHIVRLCKERFPDLQLVVRARNVQHFYELRNLGVTAIQRETFESALLSAQDALLALGEATDEAKVTIARFRSHNMAQIEATWPHHKDQDRLISMAKAGRQQLEELMAQERQVTMLGHDGIAHPTKPPHVS